MLAFLHVCTAAAQTITRIDPPNWWIGMQLNHIQLMLTGENLHNTMIESASENLVVRKVYFPESPNYAFVDLLIAPEAQSGIYTLYISGGDGITRIDFPLFTRNISAGRHMGFDEHDVIYLITPDRFANGDRTNDEIAGMRDGLNEKNIIGRHGGDIQGIMDKLDYLADLGISAIWINPLVENDMPISYHGYAVTDHYKIDPRFGSNELYNSLVDKAHKRGLKIIMDHVANHIGINHPWMKSLPQADWIHGSGNNHELNRHNKIALYDIYADPAEKSNLLTGWFVDEMPDLNQKNSFLANYLIQNTIWWIEMAGIDGIREDTYPYADPEFMSAWAFAIRREYPEITIAGEVWIHDPVFLAPFQGDNKIRDSLNTYLPVITDFGLFEAFGRVFNRKESIYEIYRFLSRDLLYSDPNLLLTFLDNHDVMRLYDLVAGNPDRYMMALKMLLTLRGIPQLYYGVEIGLSGGKDHGQIRNDFPGGFPWQKRNAFEPAGRTKAEDKIYNGLKDLLRTRKEYPALATGKMVHFKPDHEIYVYLRILNDQTMVMVANNSNEKQKHPMNRYRHHFYDKTRLREVFSGKIFDLARDVSVSIPANDVAIFVLE